jgi:hypothetical protein
MRRTANAAVRRETSYSYLPAYGDDEETTNVIPIRKLGPSSDESDEIVIEDRDFTILDQNHPLVMEQDQQLKWLIEGYEDHDRKIDKIMRQGKARFREHDAQLKKLEDDAALQSRLLKQSTKNQADTDKRVGEVEAEIKEIKAQLWDTRTWQFAEPAFHSSLPSATASASSDDWRWIGPAAGAIAMLLIASFIILCI